MGTLMDWLEGKASRVLCRLTRRHTRSCRGRPDHVRDGKVTGPR